MAKEIAAHTFFSSSEHCLQMGQGLWEDSGGGGGATEFVASVDLLTRFTSHNRHLVPRARPVIVFYIIALLSISTRKNQQQIAAHLHTAPTCPLSLLYFLFSGWGGGCFLRRVRLTPPAVPAIQQSFGNPAERLLPLLTFIFILCTHNHQPASLLRPSAPTQCGLSSK